MNKRSSGLDILRSVAVILIMLRHYAVSPVTTQIGWIGVDLFFVLSGFLVSGLLFQEYLKTNALNGKLFLIRRGFKIYPAFWFVLALNIIYLVYRDVFVQPVQVLSELFFIQNFSPGIMGISWTLAIEEHFYFLLILLAIIGVKKNRIQNRKIVTGFCITVLCTCLVLRILVNALHPFDRWTHFYPTYLRIDSLLFGVLISWFYHFERGNYVDFVNKYKYIIIFFIAMALSLPFFYPVTHPVMNTIGLTLLYIGFGGIVCFTERGNWSRSNLLKPLVYIGRYSYSIYLVHILCGPAVANFFRQNFFSNPQLEWINKCIYLLSNIVIGILFSLAIEQPFLKLREKYFPKIVAKPVVQQKPESHSTNEAAG